MVDHLKRRRLRDVEDGRQPRIARLSDSDQSSSELSTDSSLIRKSRSEGRCTHATIIIVSLLMSAGLTALVVALCKATYNKESRERFEFAFEMAEEMASRISHGLGMAMMSLFSIAQLVSEVEMFAVLPEKIGKANETGSLPFLPVTKPFLKRNITGVCDDSNLTERFDQVVSTVRENSRMEGIMFNIRVFPHGVSCLDDGSLLNPAVGMGQDMLHDPNLFFVQTKEWLKQAEIGDMQIIGPQPFINRCDSAPCAGLFFIARLPIRADGYEMEIDGKVYDRWGFLSGVFSWDELMVKAGVIEHMGKHTLEFQVLTTRPAREGDFTKDATVLASSKNFGSKNEEAAFLVRAGEEEWIIIIQQSQSRLWTLSLTQKTQVQVERKMAAYFAHELRNPLAAIDCALSSIPDDISPDLKELVSGMQLCSGFMSGIMNNLLDVRKIEEGKMELKRDPLSMEKLVRNVGQMASLAAQPGVQVKTDTSGLGDQDWVLEDEQRIQQVLTNIVSNANKYTTQGSITIVAQWEEDMVRIEVKDTGPGIPKEEQEHLFERFVMRGNAPGSGLGLAISKQIVDLIGGTIQFESDPSVKPGTTCVVCLPLEASEEGTASLSKHHISFENDDALITEKISILIVDDIKMNRLMLGKRMKKCIAPNAHVVEASTGEEALELCSKGEIFDVIILDNYMEEAGGVLHGTEVVAAMRRLGIDSMIIGCSGNDMQSNFLAVGADYVWGKPIPPNMEILQQFKIWLGRKS